MLSHYSTKSIHTNKMQEQLLNPIFLCFALLIRNAQALEPITGVIGGVIGVTALTGNFFSSKSLHRLL